MCEIPQRSFRISTGWDRPGADSVSSGAAASAASGSSITAAIIPNLSMAPPALRPRASVSRQGGARQTLSETGQPSETEESRHDFLHCIIEMQTPGGDGEIDAILPGIGNRVVAQPVRGHLEIARPVIAGCIGI